MGRQNIKKKQQKHKHHTKTTQHNYIEKQECQQKGTINSKKHNDTQERQHTEGERGTQQNDTRRETRHNDTTEEGGINDECKQEQSNET